MLNVIYKPTSKKKKHPILQFNGYRISYPTQATAAAAAAAAQFIGQSHK